ncbi:hypothetical protein T4D_13133 [Trichinella pseudospiralis]|uniref:Uncharacterized protein n=1 Tax=Trichinella pseudospiralis TaxID=6337 RepID=A0A0V1FX60_TRIPS|nr:hypothetical protein T4D_13133 [Trichinella pseudospiralis]
MKNTLRRVLTKSIFCFGVFCQIVYILTEFGMSSICNALETVFTATCAVSDFYANKGGFKIVIAITVQDYRANGVRRMNERWRFQCDGGRRIAIKTALNTRMEDGREGPEDDVYRSLYTRLRQTVSSPTCLYLPQLTNERN